MVLVVWPDRETIVTTKGYIVRGLTSAVDAEEAGGADTIH